MRRGEGVWKYRRRANHGERTETNDDHWQFCKSAIGRAHQSHQTHQHYRRPQIIGDREANAARSVFVLRRRSVTRVQTGFTTMTKAVIVKYLLVICDRASSGTVLRANFPKFSLVLCQSRLFTLHLTHPLCSESRTCLLANFERKPEWV